MFIHENPSVSTHVGIKDVIIESLVNRGVITDSSITADRMWGYKRDDNWNTYDIFSPVKKGKKTCMSLDIREFVGTFNP